MYKPPSNKKSGSSRGRSRTRSRVQPGEEKDDKDKKESKGNFIMNVVHGFFNRIDPLNLTYTETVNQTARGVQGTVPIGYKFGWRSDHGLSQDSASIGSNTGSFDHKQDVSLRSGFKLTKKQVSVFLSAKMFLKPSVDQEWNKDPSRGIFYPGEKNWIKAFRFLVGACGCQDLKSGPF